MISADIAVVDVCILHLYIDFKQSTNDGQDFTVLVYQKCT